jgi:geranylgeranyl diphosphate synthase type I
MDVKNELKIFAPKVTEEILNIIEDERKRTDGKYEHIDEMWRYVINLVQSGKRLRGAFLYYAYIMYGGKDYKEAMKAATLPELIQLYLLIIDDFQDKSEQRRGVPTMHKIYREMHSNKFVKRDPVHFGNSIAVCSGLCVNHLGFNYFTKLNFPLQNKINAITKINEQIMDVGYGQTLDIFSESMDKVSEKYVMDILLLKTAKYTYEGPLHIGAMLAGASNEELKILSDYAIPAGIAFQIQDDILGMFGDEEKLGKPVDSDLMEGKQTLLIVKALELAGKQGSEIIRKGLGNPNLTSEDVKGILKIIVDCGSLEYAKNLTKKLVLQAKTSLEASKFKDNQGYDFISGIADYMINREY